MGHHHIEKYIHDCAKEMQRPPRFVIVKSRGLCWEILVGEELSCVAERR
jgi:hypothetical protein